METVCGREVSLVGLVILDLETFSGLFSLLSVPVYLLYCSVVVLILLDSSNLMVFELESNFLRAGLQCPKFHLKGRARTMQNSIVPHYRRELLP